MVRQANPTEKQAQVLRWTARLGAITAEALADLQDAPLASARAQLVAVERQRLMVRQRPLAHHPSLFTLTSSGMRASTELGLESVPGERRQRPASDQLCLGGRATRARISRSTSRRGA